MESIPQRADRRGSDKGSEVIQVMLVVDPTTGTPSDKKRFDSLAVPVTTLANVAITQSTSHATRGGDMSARAAKMKLLPGGAPRLRGNLAAWEFEKGSVKT